MAWLLMLLVAGAGCASAAYPPESPEARVRAFAAALADERYPEAYAMMSKDYRQRVTLEAFQRLAEENPDEIREVTLALSRARGPAQQEALLRYGDRQQLKLVRERDGWRIATNVADVYDQSTPRAALRTFVEAMERRRYEVVLRLVPDSDKEGITPERMREAWEGEGREEIERMLSNLREHINNPIEQVGDRATMAYGERYTVQFVREDGRWKIEDPE
jgi:hypothetical protein